MALLTLVICQISQKNTERTIAKKAATLCLIAQLANYFMTAQHTFIPALGYAWLTSLYDLTIQLTMPEKKFRSRLVDELSPLDGEQILEFGYGTGQNLILVHQRNARVHLTGVDIDPKARQIALTKISKRNLSIQLDLYDGKTFPYPDAAFDKVVSSLVFHQLPRQTKLLCLREIHRVLKPTGKLVIGDWGKAKSPAMRTAFYLVQLLDGFATTTDNVQGRLPDFISQAGFHSISEIGYINTGLGTYSYYQATK